MKTSSAKAKSLETTEARKRGRAGKRRCRRCKTIWVREKGSTHQICLTCQTSCARCAVLLTEDTYSKVTAKRKQYYCKACVAETVRLSTDRDRQKDYDLRRNYGITVIEYQEMLEKQQGVCAICKNPPTNHKLAVDHKHAVGEKNRNPREKREQVRGLLCWHCNSALGKFNDNPSHLRAAAAYLENPPAKETIKGNSANQKTN